MSLNKHAMVAGINSKLAQMGVVAWTNSKVASDVCYDIASQLDGPDELPASGLSKESALLIADLLKQANDHFIREGALSKEAAEQYLAKTAADTNDVYSLACDVAAECMLKAAEDTLIHEPGGSGPNTLTAAAAAGNSLAKLDLKNRPEGAYNAGVGNTAMPEDVGQVGTVMPHPEAPGPSVSNSLDIKMAGIRQIVEDVKIASKQKSMVDSLKKTINGAKSTVRGAVNDAAAVRKGRPGKPPTTAGKALAAGIGGAVGAGAGYVGAEAAQDHKKKEAAEKLAARAKTKGPGLLASGLAGLAGGAVGGAGASVAARAMKDKNEKKASTEELVMRGLRKVAAHEALQSGLELLKVANPDDLDPDQLRALADYIEQHVQEQSSNVDLSQLDPQLLAALHAQGAAGDGDEDDQPQGPPGQKMAFSVTDAGHKLDAATYNRIAEALHGISQSQRQYSEEQPLLAQLLGQRREAASNQLGARHFDYAAKKHEQGQNAMNPFGGMLTRSRYEDPKQASLRQSALDRIKRAAEGGMAGETGDNTVAAAASAGDSVAKLDQKNRPEGKYDSGLGATSFPNVGQVGHSEVVDTKPANPKNTMTTELKSAGLSDEEQQFLASVEKMALLYGDQLPSTMSQGEKLAACKALVGRAPAERKAYISNLG